MAKGRSALPESQKKLQGTIRADRLKNSLQFDLIIVMPKPDIFLSDLAKKYFKRICGMLIEKKMLYSCDIHLISMLSEEMATWEEACRELKDTDKVMTVGESNYQQQSPWIGIRNNAQKNIRDIGALFGFDPLSRQKFNVPTIDKSENPFENL